MGFKLNYILIPLLLVLSGTTASSKEERPSAAYSIYELFEEAHDNHYPETVAQRPPTLHEDLRSIWISAQGAFAATPEQKINNLLGIGVRYGWTQDFETEISLPKLVLHNATSNEQDYLQELNFKGSYRLINETFSLPSITITQGFGVLDNGMAYDGVLRVEKRITGKFLTNVLFSGRHRHHYTLPNFGFITLEPQIVWSPWSRLSLRLGVATTFTVGSFDTYLRDRLGNLEAVPPRSENLYLLNPALLVGLSKNTDLEINGRVVLTSSNRKLLGHGVGIGLNFRM